jgi:CubicO group peptidase (beta-lactamase class C family)
MQTFSKKNLFILFIISISQNLMSMNEHNQHNDKSFNLDTTHFNELHQEFKKGSHGYIDSFLVIQSEEVIFEEYYEVDYSMLTKERKNEQRSIMQRNYGDLATAQYNYYDPEWHPYYKGTKLHTIQSVSKSVTSALFGIALERGEIESIDNEIFEYFTEYKHLFDSTLKKSITIRDLLNMTSGIKWDEDSHPYTDPLNDAASMENSHDWIEYILSLPMEHNPGSKFIYNSGITVLLSHILQEATGLNVAKYAEKYLFKPIGIQKYFWKKTPTGLTDAEGGLYLTTKDFAKIGLLYLNKGMSGGQQILTKDWVELTMSPGVSIEDSDRRYGFQWWFVPYGNEKEKWIFSGSGYGGQYLMVIPEYQLVIVFNGWNIFDTERPSIEYLSSRIMEAVIEKK